MLGSGKKCPQVELDHVTAHKGILQTANVGEMNARPSIKAQPNSKVAAYWNLNTKEEHQRSPNNMIGHHWSHLLCSTEESQSYSFDD